MKVISGKEEEKDEVNTNNSYMVQLEMSSIEDKIVNTGDMTMVAVKSKRTDSKTKKKKLQNNKTGETKLEKNTTSTIVDESGLVHAQSNPMDKQQTKGHRSTSTDLPEDWTKEMANGRKYYANRKTQESSWTPPVGSTGGSVKNTIALGSNSMNKEKQKRKTKKKK